MNSIQYIKVLKQENGNVMIIALMVLAILSIIGFYTINISMTEQEITVNVQTQKMAFYDADSGVQYAIGSLENDLKSGAPGVLPTSVDPASADNKVAYAYGTPVGFSFAISSISMAGPNAYAFTSTGNAVNAYRNAQALINATFKRKGAINFAAFGDEKLDTKSNGNTWSYDSSSPEPSKNDPSGPTFQSTHEADIGSNDWLITHNGAAIDGDAVFGEQDDGTTTTDGLNSGTDIHGTAGVDAGRIDPDPLGVSSGGIYDPYNYQLANDNALSSVGTTINTNGSVTLVGKPGGANYYFTDITLNNGANLTIDTTSGPVNIFLEGGFEAKNGSTINVVDSAGNPGLPTDFAIYSNSTAKIDFKHDSEFRGFVYAPYADIDMKNSSDVYGAIWGNNVDIKNSGTLYYDEALKDKYLTDNLALLSWKEVL